MTITRTFRNLSSLKLISSFLGLLYSIILVRLFGTGRMIEVFFAAQSVVYLITSLTQSGQLAEVFLPEYVLIKKIKGSIIASRAFSVVTNRVSIFVLVLISIAYLLAPFLISIFIPGFENSDQKIATLIFRSFLPLILLQILSSFINTVLNAEKIYGRLEVAGIINYIVSLFALIFFYKSLGIWILVIALYLGKIIELCIGIYFLFAQKIKWSPIFSDPQFNHKELFYSLYSTLSYTGSTQILNWAYTAGLSFMPQGSYAIFRYVNLLFDKTGSILADPIKTILFTDLSIIAAKKNYTKSKKFFEKSIQYGILVGIFVFSVAIYSGMNGLSFLWGGDKFNELEIRKAYKLLVVFYSLFVVQIAYSIIRKFVVANGLAKKVYQYQAITQFVSAIIVYACISYFGFIGLIVGILVNRILLILVPFYISNNYLSERIQWPQINYFVKVVVGLIVISLSYVLLSNFVEFKGNFGGDKMMDAFYCILWGSVGCLIYYFTYSNLNLINVSDIQQSLKYQKTKSS